MDLASFAKIDLRFDQTLDYTASGVLVNSFDAVKPIVDRIKSLGYAGVQLQTNVPINVESGRIDTFDETTAEGVQDKSLPDDFWKIAQYAADLGLDVAVRADPVNYTNDAVINRWSPVGPNFNVHEFFNSLITYETQLARDAQAAGVDLFYIGSMQGGFDDYQYLPLWQQLVTSVRGVFSGDLAYMSHYEGYTPVWDLVDVIGLCFDPNLSKTPTYDMKTIMDFYKHADAPEGRVTDIVSAIKHIHEINGKPIILEDIRFDAGDNALGNYIDYFNLALNQTLIDQAPNTALQTTRIHAFFEMLKTELGGGIVDGVQIREYMPWMQTSWVTESAGPWGAAFHQSSVNGFDLYNQPEAEKAFSYFLKEDNEAIVGTANADNLWIYSGNHLVDGNEGIDRAEFFNPLNYCDVHRTGDKVSVTNWIDGTITLEEVERLHFADVDLAFDIDGHAGQAYRLYKAAFDRVPDLEGLGFWIDALDDGTSLNAVADCFVNSAEFQYRYGSAVSDQFFVTKLYNNVLDRAPEQAGFDYWMYQLQNGMSRESVLICFSESIENQRNLEPLVANGIQYQEWIF